MPPAVNRRGELQTASRRTTQNDKELLQGTPGFSPEKQIRHFRCSNLGRLSATLGPVCDAVIRLISIRSWHSATQQPFNVDVSTLPVHTNANVHKFVRLWITLTHLNRQICSKIIKNTPQKTVKVFKEDQKQPGKNANLGDDPRTAKLSSHVFTA